MFKKSQLLAIGSAIIASSIFSMPALAESLPSSKATFAYAGVVALPPITASTSGTPSADSGWTTILRSKIRTANQKDLFINPSLQCGIVTDTTVKSLNGSLDIAEARATIRVRVKITDEAGVVRYAEPNNTGLTADGSANDDGLVYCDRIQTLKAKFSGLNCTADLSTGEVTCADPEELQLILKTLNANSFNFVAADLSSGIQTIDVQARTSANVGTDSTNGSLAGAEAFIGAGSVSVEEVRMIKGNDGSTLDF